MRLTVIHRSNAFGTTFGNSDRMGLEQLAAQSGVTANERRHVLGIDLRGNVVRIDRVHGDVRMIQCRNCETAQFLQIMDSRIRWERGSVTEIDETYECTMCGAEGSYEFNGRDGIRVSGEVRETGDNPVMSA